MLERGLENLPDESSDLIRVIVENWDNSGWWAENSDGYPNWEDLSNAFIGSSSRRVASFAALASLAAHVSRPVEGDVEGQDEGSSLERDMALQANVVLFLAHLSRRWANPFWSNRYWGHMNSDVLMVSILAGLAVAPFNPNQAAPEGSPVTTALELVVGRQLARMLGFDPTESPRPWGHLPSSGTLANIEALWTARNLKLWPLSYAIAQRGGVVPDVSVTLDGQELQVSQLEPMELLRLEPNEALAIADRAVEENSERQEILERVDRFSVRKRGIAWLVDAQTGRWPESADLWSGALAVVAPCTSHYSIEKASTLMGFGDPCHVNVTPGTMRMDIDDLTKELKALKEKRVPVAAVVALMGNTEHGAVDPLDRVLEIRADRKDGFWIHADAAYGGYFASILRGDQQGDLLNDHTRTQLAALPMADSVTVDPHKSGFVQYNAGGLVYRDERMLPMIETRAPVVFQDAEELSEEQQELRRSAGPFLLEGSRAGGSAAAVWAAHEVMPLDANGYGRLLQNSIRSSRVARRAIEAHVAESDLLVAFLAAPEHDLNILSMVFATPSADAEQVNLMNTEIYRRRAIEYLGDIEPDLQDTRDCAPLVTKSRLPHSRFRAVIEGVRNELNLPHCDVDLDFLVCTLMHPFVPDEEVEQLGKCLVDVASQVAHDFGI